MYRGNQEEDLSDSRIVSRFEIWNKRDETTSKSKGAADFRLLGLKKIFKEQRKIGQQETWTKLTTYLHSQQTNDFQAVYEKESIQNLRFGCIH